MSRHFERRLIPEPLRPRKLVIQPRFLTVKYRRFAYESCLPLKYEQ